MEAKTATGKYMMCTLARLCINQSIIAAVIVLLEYIGRIAFRAIVYRKNKLRDLMICQCIGDGYCCQLLFLW